MQPWTWEHDIPDHCYLLGFSLVPPERLQRWLDLRASVDLTALQVLVDRPYGERTWSDACRLREGAEAVIAACARYADRDSLTWPRLEQARQKRLRAHNSQDLSDLGFMVDWVERELLGLVDPRGSSPRAPFGIATTVHWFAAWLRLALGDGPSLIPTDTPAQVVTARTYGAATYAWLSADQAAQLARRPLRLVAYEELNSVTAGSAPMREVHAAQVSTLAAQVSLIQETIAGHTGYGYIGWYTRNNASCE